MCCPPPPDDRRAVVQRRPRQPYRVDAVMLIKVIVFDGDDRVRQLGRDIRQWRIRRMVRRDLTPCQCHQIGGAWRRIPQLAKDDEAQAEHCQRHNCHATDNFGEVLLRPSRNMLSFAARCWRQRCVRAACRLLAIRAVRRHGWPSQTSQAACYSWQVNPLSKVW